MGERPRGEPLGEGLLGSGGTISITARNLAVNKGASINAKTLGDNTSPPAANFLNMTPLPSSGTVDINVTDIFTLSDVIFDAEQASISEISVSATGAASVGTIDVEAGTINIEKGARINASTVSETSTDTRGSISVNARGTIKITGFDAPNPGMITNQSLRRSQIVAVTAGVQDAGSITVKANNLVIDNGGLIDSTATNTTTPPPAENRAETTGTGGDITVIAAEGVTISGRASGQSQSLQSAILSVARSNGKAGNISITANNVTLRDGGIITAASQPGATNIPGGAGGTVTVRANDTLTVTGVNRELEGRPFESRISSSTTGNQNAGDVFVSADNINVIGGGSINVGTKGDGNGGLIRLVADKTFSADGQSVVPGNQGETRRSTISSSSEGKGNSGTVTITAGDILVQNGAKVSTSASGNGKAGDINLGNAQEIQLDGGIIETTAARDAGGNIKLTASDLILIKESQINTSVQGDASNQGGNINIDPEFIVMINSQLEAKAAEGAGGNMDIVANVIFTDFRSSFDATGGDPLAKRDYQHSGSHSKSQSGHCPITRSHHRSRRAL